MIDGLPDPLPRGIINGSISSVAVPINTSTEMLGPSPKRVGLLISIATGTNATINNRPITGASDGFQWTAGQSPLYLDEEQFGHLVKKPWFVLAAGAATTASWIELLRD